MHEACFFGETSRGDDEPGDILRVWSEAPGPAESAAVTG